jgi:hypothetical protein
MDTKFIKGDWIEMKEILKQRYSISTDDDLFFAAGKENELLAKLRQQQKKPYKVCDIAKNI